MDKIQQDETSAGQSAVRTPQQHRAWPSNRRTQGTWASHRDPRCSPRTVWGSAAIQYLGEVAASTVELLLPNPCAGCGRGGGPWCSACGDAVHDRPPFLAVTDAGHLVSAVGPYRGALRSAIVSYKEKQRRDLAKTLGGYLAASVQANCGEWRGHVVLVPAPSRPWANRWRGMRHMERLALVAAGHLQRTTSLTCTVWPVLATRWRAQDQQRLSDSQRKMNADAAIYLKLSQLRAIEAYGFSAEQASLSTCRLIVVDDVVTSGATVDRCLEVLAAAGYRSSSVAVICHARQARTSGV